MYLTIFIVHPILNNHNCSKPHNKQLAYSLSIRKSAIPSGINFAVSMEIHPNPVFVT